MFLNNQTVEFVKLKPIFPKLNTALKEIKMSNLLNKFTCNMVALILLPVSILNSQYF